MLQNRRSTTPMRGQIALAIASVAIIAGVAAALSAPQVSLAAADSATASSVSDTQKTQRVFDDTNEVRAEAGTTPLVRNAALDKVAADWAYQQWKNGAMSHNPNYSTQIPAGWSHAGENVAAGYTYDTVVTAWKNSPEHYKNLVGDYTDIGIGYYEGPDGNRYWVQEFAKYSSTQVPPKQTPTASPSATPSATPTATPTAAPSTTATSAPAPASGSTSSAEPAAPAGTSIALSSPSFEGSTTGWTAPGSALDGPNGTAKGGRYALSAKGGTTVSQSVTTTVTAGETDTATIWVKPSSSAAATGTLKLSAVGGTAETAAISFQASSGWMRVSAALPVSKSGHTGLKIEVVVDSAHASLLDSASLVRTKDAPAPSSPTPSAPSPATTPAATPPGRTTSTTSSAPAPAPANSSSPAPAADGGSPGLNLGLLSIGLGG